MKIFVKLFLLKTKMTKKSRRQIEKPSDQTSQVGGYYNPQYARHDQTALFHQFVQFMNQQSMYQPMFQPQPYQLQTTFQPPVQQSFYQPPVPFYQPVPSVPTYSNPRQSSSPKVTLRGPSRVELDRTRTATISRIQHRYHESDSESDSTSDLDLDEDIDFSSTLESELEEVNLATSTVYFWVRVSTKKQFDKDNSPSSQQTICHIINEMVKGPIQPVLKSIFGSAYISMFDEKGNFKPTSVGSAWSEILRKRTKPIIICRTACRFSRNVEDAKKLLGLIDKKGGRVLFGVVKNEGANGSCALTYHSSHTPQGRALLLEMVRIGEEQSRQIGYASKEGRKASKRKLDDELPIQKQRRELESRNTKIQALVAAMRSNHQEAKTLKQIVKLLSDCKQNGMDLAIFNQRFKDLIPWELWPQYKHNKEHPLSSFYGDCSFLRPEDATSSWFAQLLYDWKVHIPQVPAGFKGQNTWDDWDEKILDTLLENQFRENLTQRFSEILTPRQGLPANKVLSPQEHVTQVSPPITQLRLDGKSRSRDSNEDQTQPQNLKENGKKKKTVRSGSASSSSASSFSELPIIRRR